MSGEIRTEALIHDLAIVLRGCLHPSAMIGPAPRLAASRIRDVLRITPGELTAGIEDRFADALTCKCCVDNECECVNDEEDGQADDIACGQADEN